MQEAKTQLPLVVLKKVWGEAVSYICGLKEDYSRLFQGQRAAMWVTWHTICHFLNHKSWGTVSLKWRAWDKKHKNISLISVYKCYWSKQSFSCCRMLVPLLKGPSNLAFWRQGYTFVYILLLIVPLQFNQSESKPPHGVNNLLVDMIGWLVDLTVKPEKNTRSLITTKQYYVTVEESFCAEAES